METILNITYLYLLVLLLALLVERVMEVIMVIWELVEQRSGGHKFWNKRTHKLKNQLARSVETRMKERKLSTLTIRRRVRQYTNAQSGFYPGKTIVFSSKRVRKSFVRMIVFFVTSGLGMLVCFLAGINLIEIVKEALAPQTFSIFDAIGRNLQMIISGLIVGLGAEPVHRLIKRLEEAKNWIDQRNRLNEELIEEGRLGIDSSE